MGRVKTKQVKRRAHEMLQASDKFNKEFEHNKQVLNEIAVIPSKKMRNVIAGYVTRIVKAMRHD